MTEEGIGRLRRKDGCKVTKVTGGNIIFFFHVISFALYLVRGKHSKENVEVLVLVPDYGV